MNTENIICYSCFTDYEEYEVFPKLENLIQNWLRDQDPLNAKHYEEKDYFNGHFIGFVHFSDGEKKKAFYDDRITTTKELSEQEKKKVEFDLDQEIKRCEDRIKEMLNGSSAPITGYFGPTNHDKPRELERRLEMASVSIFDKIDPAKIEYR